jgi:signal transduction histidine kinase/DNA-binding response OmpR family regulator
MDVWGKNQPIQTGSVSLEASQRVFTLDYTAMSWPDGARVQFQYRLEGHDDDWIDAGFRRQVVYGGLGPGRYTFRVRAMNHAGEWSRHDATLSIPIAPFYYEQAWFWLLGGVLALTLFGGVHRWRIRSQTQRERRLEAQMEERTAVVARQAEELRALDKAKSRFFANISHEFRTPLTLSMGPLEDVRTDRHGVIPTEAKQRIDLALLNNRRLLRLVNQLLDIAKLEAHTLTLHARPIDLAALLQRLKMAFTPLAERKRMTYSDDVPDLNSDLYGDPDQLEKVFTNLLSNAFKFTPDGGKIHVDVDPNPVDIPCADRESSGWVAVHVRDTGPGIPPDQRDHVFDRFYQTETGSNHADVGTGIGLALVRELVTVHRGCVDITDTDGWGTTFSVYLRTGAAHLEDRSDVELEHSPAEVKAPADLEEVRIARESRTATEEHVPAGADDELEDEDDRLTILIVDDNAEVRAFIREHLEPQYRTVGASDGRSGLSEARALTPDLIVSDVMMPEMDGYELCRAVKQDPELGFIPVVLLTARAGSEDKLEGLEGGADDYLTKPFDMAELKTRIANLIALRQRLKAQFRAEAVSQVPALDVKSTDDVFREGVRAAVEANLSDEDFGVLALAEAVALDRSHLYRRMMETLGKSPSAYVKEMRLERAAGLLRAGAGTVSEIAYGVGFRSVPHFTTVFRERYGCTPTQFL